MSSGKRRAEEDDNDKDSYQRQLHERSQRYKMADINAAILVKIEKPDMMPNSSAASSSASPVPKDAEDAVVPGGAAAGPAAPRAAVIDLRDSPEPETIVID